MGKIFKRSLLFSAAFAAMVQSQASGEEIFLPFGINTLMGHPDIILGDREKKAAPESEKLSDIIAFELLGPLDKADIDVNREAEKCV